MSSLRGYIVSVTKQLLPEDGEGVRDRAVKSGIWVALINVFDRILQLAKVAVLAHLLVPKDFGLMGIALLTLAVFKRFSRLGINEALVQRKEANVDKYLNTAWVLRIGRGMAIATIAVLLAPYVAAFFGEPRAKDIIRVIAISPVLTGFRNPGVMYLQKNLDFHKKFLMTISGSVMSTAITIGFALLYRNVWALVVGYIVSDLTRTVVSYLVHEYRPSLQFTLDLGRELLDYGKWITLTHIIVFFMIQGDDAFVGWFLTASALGFYQMAYRFGNAPVTELREIVRRVAFPTYSQLQDDATKLRESFLQSAQLTAFVSFPAAIGTIAIAPTLVNAVLGNKWSPAILTLQILVVGGLVRSVHLAAEIFKVIGHPDYVSKFHGLKLLIIIIFIYPATETWGVEGTAFIIVGAFVLITPVEELLAVKKLQASYQSYVIKLGYPFLASATMGIGVYLLRENIRLESQLLKLLILIISGAFLYIAVISIIEKETNYDTINLLYSFYK